MISEVGGIKYLKEQEGWKRFIGSAAGGFALLVLGICSNI